MPARLSHHHAASGSPRAPCSVPAHIALPMSHPGVAIVGNEKFPPCELHQSRTAAFNADNSSEALDVVAISVSAAASIPTAIVRITSIPSSFSLPYQILPRQFRPKGTEWHSRNLGNSVV